MHRDYTYSRKQNKRNKGTNLMKYNQFKKEFTKFINDYFYCGISDTKIRSGKDGMNYSEFARAGHIAWVSMVGSPMYDLINNGTDGWKFQTKLNEWLSKRGLCYEQGHAWNMHIMDENY